jgi:hypothetical protein
VHSASYTYCFADYQASRAARRKLSPLESALWPWRYALLIGINLLVLLIVIWNGDLTPDQIFSRTYLSGVLLIYAGLLVTFTLIDLLIDRALPAWVFKRFSMADRPLAFTFDDSGIHWSSEDMKGEFAWSRVKKIVMFKDDAFLFISKLEALCIPHRAFSSKDAFDRFVIYAKERANGKAL